MMQSTYNAFVRERRRDACHYRGPAHAFLRVLRENAVILVELAQATTQRRTLRLGIALGANQDEWVRRVVECGGGGEDGGRFARAVEAMVAAWIGALSEVAMDGADLPDAQQLPLEAFVMAWWSNGWRAAELRSLFERYLTVVWDLRRRRQQSPDAFYTGALYCVVVAEQLGVWLDHHLTQDD